MTSVEQDPNVRRRWDTHTMRALRTVVVGASAVALLASSVAGASASSGLARTVPASDSAAAKQATGACSPYAVMKSMTLQQRVGQIFMVGTPATKADPTVLDQITRYHVGNIFLSGRSTGGTAAPSAVTAAARARVNASSTANTPLFVATDQEGGYVQVLQGSGFSRMPTALAQGAWSDVGLQQAGTTWGSQLRRVGVNLNLAPVADTVPNARWAAQNPPIGVFQREYGYSSSITAAKSVDIVRGMSAAGVGTTSKHFPGLGLVNGNTDTSYGVHDRITTSVSPYLNPFRADMTAGVTAVMMSSAIYDKIDPTTLAVFSPKVVNLVRSTGFSGPIMTDDMGNAVQPGRWTVAHRAVNSLQAGVDMILTVNPSVVPTMYNEVLSLAQTSSYWQSRVNSAAWWVLMGKAQRGLLPSCG